MAFGALGSHGRARAHREGQRGAVGVKQHFAKVRLAKDEAGARRRRRDVLGADVFGADAGKRADARDAATAGRADADDAEAGRARAGVVAGSGDDRHAGADLHVALIGKRVVGALRERAPAVAHLGGRSERRAGIALVGDARDGHGRIGDRFGRDLERLARQRDRVVRVGRFQRAHRDAVAADALSALTGKAAGQRLAADGAAIGRADRGIRFAVDLALAGARRHGHRALVDDDVQLHRLGLVLRRVGAAELKGGRGEVVARVGFVEIGIDDGDVDLVAGLDALDGKVVCAEIQPAGAIICLFDAAGHQREGQRNLCGRFFLRAADGAHAVFKAVFEHDVAADAGDRAAARDDAALVGRAAGAAERAVDDDRSGTGDAQRAARGDAGRVLRVDAQRALDAPKAAGEHGVVGEVAVDLDADGLDLIVFQDDLAGVAARAGHDGLDGDVELKILERAAAVKQAAAHLLERIGKSDFLQRSAAGERAALQAQHAVRHDDFHKRPVARKRRARDGCDRHAVHLRGNRHGTARAGVAGERQRAVVVFVKHKVAGDHLLGFDAQQERRHRNALRERVRRVGERRGEDVFRLFCIEVRAAPRHGNCHDRAVLQRRVQRSREDGQHLFERRLFRKRSRRQIERRKGGDQARRWIG